MNVTTVGLKAVLSSYSARQDVGATSNLTITANRMISVYSIENVACELEVKEHDNTTWTALEDVASLVISDTLAPNPVIHPPLFNDGNNQRWRNPTAGALWIKAYGWYLT